MQHRTTLGSEMSQQFTSRVDKPTSESSRAGLLTKRPTERLQSA